MTTQTVFPVGGIAGASRGDLHETSRFGALMARLEHRWATYQTYRATLDELRTLSDRELDDIGISRWDIQRIAREAAAQAHPAQA